ncbi:hypothetical protein C0995_015846 [Termitomyces sp. Mi166|nr:hypothetical protein C0995_015846 [Termitomyces sp. Mi166\
MHYLYYFQEPFRRIHRRAIQHVRRFTTDHNSQSMRNEIGMLVNTVSDPTEKKTFTVEMQTFSKLLNRYIAEASKKIDWEKVHPLAADQIIHYDQLPRPTDDLPLLKKLAVLKVNGGLGTSMGLNGAKSALEVKDGFTFLDLAIQQIANVNTNYGVDIPLLLMTSFNTHDDSLRITQEYSSKQVRIKLFMQSKYPRIMKDSLLPCPKDGHDKTAWYPPGHGDLYAALYRSGELNRLIKEGKEYLFVSNCDNLGAVILQHVVDTKADFIMEVADKTKADIEACINYDGTIRLLEIGQVPSDHVKNFTSALKKIMDEGGMELEIIGNFKVTNDGRSVLQLETAAGAAIRYFGNARGVNVPRSRFTPVQSCSDLLLLKSDLFTLENGPVLSRDRLFNTIPVIKLGSHFQKVDLLAMLLD